MPHSNAVHGFFLHNNLFNISKQALNGKVRKFLTLTLFEVHFSRLRERLYLRIIPFRALVVCLLDCFFLTLLAFSFLLAFWDLALRTAQLDNCVSKET